MTETEQQLENEHKEKALTLNINKILTFTTSIHVPEMSHKPKQKKLHGSIKYLIRNLTHLEETNNIYFFF